MDKCNHLNEDGSCAIVFLDKKWCGIYPPYVKGICTKCKEQVKVSKEEYDKHKNGGDIIETNI